MNTRFGESHFAGHYGEGSGPEMYERDHRGSYCRETEFSDRRRNYFYQRNACYERMHISNGSVYTNERGRGMGFGQNMYPKMNGQPVKGRHYNQSNYFNQGNDYHQDTGFNKRGRGRDKYSFRGRGGSKPYNSHKPHYNEFSKSMKFSSNHTPCGEFKASPYSASRDLQDSTYRSSEEATRSSSRSLSPDGKDGEKMTGKENTRSYYKYSTDSERNRKGSSYHDRDRHYKRYKDYNERYDKDRRYSNDSEKSRYVGGDKRREFEGSRKRSADRDSVPSAANKVREDAKRQKRTLLSDRFRDISSSKTTFSKTEVNSEKSKTVTKSEQFSSDSSRKTNYKSDLRTELLLQSEKFIVTEKSEDLRIVQAKSDSEASKSDSKECTDSDGSFEMKVLDEAEISGKSEEGNKSISDDMELSEVEDSRIIVGKGTHEKLESEKSHHSEKVEIVGNSEEKEEGSKPTSPLQTLVLEVVEDPKNHDIVTNKTKHARIASGDSSKDSDVPCEKEIAYVSNISEADVSTLDQSSSSLGIPSISHIDMESSEDIGSESDILGNEDESGISQVQSNEESGVKHSVNSENAYGSPNKNCVSDKDENTAQCNLSQTEVHSKETKSTVGNKNNNASSSDSLDDFQVKNPSKEHHTKESNKDGKSDRFVHKHSLKKRKASGEKQSSKSESRHEKSKIHTSSSDGMKEKHKLKRMNSSLEEEAQAKRARHKTSEGSEFHVKKSRKDSGKNEAKVQEQNNTQSFNSKEGIDSETDKEESDMKRMKKLPQLDVVCDFEGDDSLPQMLSPAAQKAKRLARKMSIAKESALNNPESEKSDSESGSKPDNVKEVKERRKSGSVEKTKAQKSSAHLFGPPPDLFAPDPVTTTKKKTDAEERLAQAKEKVKSKTPNAKAAKEVNISKSAKGKIQVTEKSLKHSSKKSLKNPVDTPKKREGKILSLAKKNKQVDASTMKSSNNKEVKVSENEESTTKSSNKMEVKVPESDTSTMKPSNKKEVKVSESVASSMKSSNKTEVKVSESESTKLKVKDVKRSLLEGDGEEKRKKVEKPKDRNIFDICNFSESTETTEKKRNKSGEKERDIKSKVHHRKEGSCKTSEGVEKKNDSSTTKDKSQSTEETSKSVIPESTENSIPNQLVSNMGESISIFGEKGVAVFGSKKSSSASIDTSDEAANTKSDNTSNKDWDSINKLHSNSKKSSIISGKDVSSDSKSDEGNAKCDTSSTSSDTTNTQDNTANTETENRGDNSDWRLDFDISSDSERDDEEPLTSEKPKSDLKEPGHQSYDDISSCDDDDGRLQIDLSRQSLSDTRSSDEKLDESLDHDDTLDSTVVYDGNNTIVSNANTSNGGLDDKTLPYTTEDNQNAESSTEDANSDPFNSSHENLLEEVNSGDVQTFLFNKGIPESPWTPAPPTPAPPTPAPPTPAAHVGEEEEEDPSISTYGETTNQNQSNEETTNQNHQMSENHQMSKNNENLASKEGSQEDKADESLNPEMEILEMVNLRPSVTLMQNKKQNSVEQDDNSNSGVEVEKSLSQHTRDIDNTLKTMKREIDSEESTDSCSQSSVDSDRASSLSSTCSSGEIIIKREQDQDEPQACKTPEKEQDQTSESTVSPKRKIRSISTDTGLKQLEVRKSKSAVDQKQQVAMLSLLKELRQTNFSSCAPIAFTHIKTLVNGRTVNTIGHLDAQKFKETKLTIIQCQGCQRWFTCSEFFLHVDGDEEVSNESVRAEPWPTRKLSELEQSVWEKFLRIKSYFMEKVIPGSSEAVSVSDSMSSLHTIPEVPTSNSTTCNHEKQQSSDSNTSFITTSQATITTDAIVTQISSTSTTAAVSVTSSSQYMSMPVLVGTVSNTVLPPLQPQLTTTGSSSSGRPDGHQEKSSAPVEQAIPKHSQVQKSLAPPINVSNQNSGVTASTNQKPASAHHPFHRSVSDSQLPRQQANSSMINHTSTRQPAHLRSPPNMAAQQVQRNYPGNVNAASQSCQSMGSAASGNTVRQMPQPNNSQSIQIGLYGSLSMSNQGRQVPQSNIPHQPLQMGNYGSTFTSVPQHTPAPPPLHRFTNHHNISATTFSATASSSRPTVSYPSSENWTTNHPKFPPQATHNGGNQGYQPMNNASQNFQPINKQLLMQPQNQMAQNQMAQSQMAPNVHRYSHGSCINNGQSVSLRDVPYVNPSHHSMQNKNHGTALHAGTERILMEYAAAQTQKQKLEQEKQKQALAKQREERFERERLQALQKQQQKTLELQRQRMDFVEQEMMYQKTKQNLLRDLEASNMCANSRTRNNEVPVSAQCDSAVTKSPVRLPTVPSPDLISGVDLTVRNRSNSEPASCSIEDARPLAAQKSKNSDNIPLDFCETNNSRAPQSTTCRDSGETGDNATRSTSEGSSKVRNKSNIDSVSQPTESEKSINNARDESEKDKAEEMLPSNNTNTGNTVNESSENTRNNENRENTQNNRTDNTREDNTDHNTDSLPLSFETLASQIKNLDECSHLMTMSYQLNFAVFDHMRKSLEETKAELKKLKEENEKLKAENEQNLKQMEEQNSEIASLIAFKESIVNIATRKDS